MTVFDLHAEKETKDMKLTMCALMLAGMSTLSASIILSTEAAGVQQSSVAGITTVNFNALATGALGVYASPIGTYSAGAIVGPNAYGGANQTNYISVGAQSGTLSYSLTFSGLQDFFGLYWAAGDAHNRLDFYQGAILLTTFQLSDYTGSLSAAYFGNPNTGQNPSEKYAYLNFTSNNLLTNFDRVVFRNINTSTGFETDNHSISASGPPSAVPEPSAAAMLLAGLGLLAVALSGRRRRRV